MQIFKPFCRSGFAFVARPPFEHVVEAGTLRTSLQAAGPAFGGRRRQVIDQTRA
jgi:hypothetical protein